MAGRYSATIQSLVFAKSTGPVCDIRPSATDAGVRLMELFVMLNSPGASAPILSIGLGVPASIGSVRSTTAPQPHDPNSPACTVQIGYDWTVLPVGPTNFLRRAGQFSATAGGLLTWRFPNGLSAANGLVLYVTASQVTMSSPVFFDVSAEIDV
jgi:hypothetical protein